MTFNGVVRWTDRCTVKAGVNRGYIDLEPDTTYRIVLRIEAPTPGSRATVSDPVFHTTGPAPAAPDCTTDPLPPGC